jgi:SAM-dependent methyltransferase
MFHVLEHVQSESEAIKEAHRVLKKKGILYLASPYRGMFTWADTANLRYRFPLIHKKFMELSLGKKEYDNRFIKQQKQGLYGDCTSTRTWHKHYKEHEISTLLNGKFDIEEFYKFSLFHPFLLVMQNVFDYFFKRKSDLVKKMIWYDNKLNAGELSYNMLAICTKK